MTNITNLVINQYPSDGGRDIVLSKVKKFYQNPSVSRAQELENLVEGISPDVEENPNGGRNHD